MAFYVTPTTGLPASSSDAKFRTAVKDNLNPKASITLDVSGVTIPLGMNYFHILNQCVNQGTISEAGYQKSKLGHLMPYEVNSPFWDYGVSDPTARVQPKDYQFLADHDGTMVLVNITGNVTYKSTSDALSRPDIIFPDTTYPLYVGDDYTGSRLPIAVRLNDFTDIILPKRNAPSPTKYSWSYNTTSGMVDIAMKNPLASSYPDLTYSITAIQFPTDIDTVTAISIEQVKSLTYGSLIGDAIVHLVIDYTKVNAGSTTSETFDITCPLSSLAMTPFALESISAYLERARCTAVRYSFSTLSESTLSKKLEKLMPESITIVASYGNASEYHARAVSPSAFERSGLWFTNASDGDLILNNFQSASSDDQKDFWLVDERVITKDYDGTIIINPECSPTDIYVYGYGTLDGKMTLVDNWLPAGEASNISVTYPCSDVSVEDNYIDKCRFGCLFGTSNARNRLFASGNPDKPNYDWHTGDNDSQGDFTYFPDSAYCAYGTDSTPVIGYGMVSDGKLLVVKGNGREPSVFYRTGTYTTLANSEALNVSIETEAYPLTMTNAKVGAIDFGQFTDFCGDSIWVSDDGEIVGLDTSDNTYNSSKVASSRSSLIDKEIRKKKAVSNLLHSEGNTLYYATNDCLYVTDYSNKYEWFKTDLQNVTAILRMSDGRTIYGNGMGDVCEFTPDEYEDVETYPVQLDYDATQLVGGHISISGRNKFACSSRVKDIITMNLTEEEFEAYRDLTIGEKVAGGGSATCSDDETYDYIINGASNVALDVTRNWKWRCSRQISFGWIMWKNENVIVNLDIDHPDTTVKSDDLEERDYYVKIYDEFVKFRPFFNGTPGRWELEFEAGLNPTKICEAIKENGLYLKEENVTYRIIDIDKTNSTFRIEVDDENWHDWQVYDVDKAYLSSRIPVYAWYITAPFTAGTLEHKKTLWGYTIVADTGETNDIRVARATNDTTLDILIDLPSHYQNDYSMDDLDYSRVTFEKFTLPHTYTCYRPLGVSFVCFRMESVEAENSALTALQFTYSLSGKMIVGKE